MNLILIIHTLRLGCMDRYIIPALTIRKTHMNNFSFKSPPSDDLEADWPADYDSLTLFSRFTSPGVSNLDTCLNFVVTNGTCCPVLLDWTSFFSDFSLLAGIAAAFSL